MHSTSIFLIGPMILGLLLLGVPDTSGSLMLGSLLMALKGGIFASKMGVGGLLAMMLAASHNQDGGFGARSLVDRRRSTRSVPEGLSAIARVQVNDGTLPENKMPPPELAAEKLAVALNNAGLPATQRVMRQVAILDQLSCLPKVLCGMNTKSPSSNTNLLNDYGFLIKYLFQSDDKQEDDEQNDDDDEQDDDERDIDDEEDEALRAEGLVAKRKGADGENKAKKNSDDESGEDDQLDEMAQEELLDDEPEMMRYVLAEMNDKMKKLKPSGYPDHSELPGYNIESYASHKNPALSTASSQAILNSGSSSHLLSSSGNKGGTGVIFGNKNIQFKLGSSDEHSPSLLGSILPSFVYKKIKSPDAEPASDDPFANDPFFADFRRRRDLKIRRKRQVKTKKGSDNNDKVKNEPTTLPQRANDRFKRIAYMAEKKELLEQSSDPLTKYQVALDVGRKTKSGRQCRLLFAKCPYEYNEIMAMIDNVKKVVTAQGESGLKLGGAQSDSGISTITTGGTGINLQTGNGKPGVTQISHQLDNGDKVEIMLKIKSKDEGKLGSSSYHVTPKIRDPALVSADKSLQDMKKALQALVKLHNQTESKLNNLEKQKQSQTLGPYRIKPKLGYNKNAANGLPTAPPADDDNGPQSDDPDQDQADTNTSNSSSKEKSSEETKGSGDKKKKETGKETEKAAIRKGDSDKKKKKPCNNQSTEKEDEEGSEEDDQEQEDEDEDTEDEQAAGSNEHDEKSNHVPSRTNYRFPASGYRPHITSGSGGTPHHHHPQHQHQPPLRFFRKQPAAPGPFYMDYQQHQANPHLHHHLRVPPSQAYHLIQQKQQQQSQQRPEKQQQRPKKQQKQEQKKQEDEQQVQQSTPAKAPETENPALNPKGGRLPAPLPPRPSPYKIVRPRNRYRPRTSIVQTAVIPKQEDVVDEEIIEDDEIESR